MKLRLLAFCFLLGLCCSVSAEEVWVRNKPFEGAVSGSGPGLKVELQAVLQALNLEATIANDAVIFGDFRIPIETTADGKQMVLLKDLSVGANLTVTRNKELGTIDVYSTTAGVKPADDFSTSMDGSAQAAGGSGYSFSLPPQLELVNDPSVVEGLVQEMGGLPAGKLNCLVVSKNKQEEALIMLFSFPPAEAGALRSLSPEAIGKSMEQQDSKQISGPTKATISGLPFYKFQHSMVKNGRAMIAETYWCLQSPSKQAWLAMYIAGQANFESSAPPFRQAIQTMVVK